MSLRISGLVLFGRMRDMMGERCGDRKVFEDSSEKVEMRRPRSRRVAENRIRSDLRTDVQ